MVEYQLFFSRQRFLDNQIVAYLCDISLSFLPEEALLTHTTEPLHLVCYKFRFMNDVAVIILTLACRPWSWL